MPYLGLGRVIDFNQFAHFRILFLWSNFRPPTHDFSLLPNLCMYSETVKFGHVTFFWNGNRSGYFNDKMEEYVEIPSDSGITFNVQPKMKAIEIAEKARDAILSGKFEQVMKRPTIDF